jgi:hypothetical protein
VARSQAADCLHRARKAAAVRVDPIAHPLWENHDGVLTRGLCTPLALTLIRDTYRPDDDVSLLTTRWGTADG